MKSHTAMKHKLNALASTVCAAFALCLFASSAQGATTWFSNTNGTLDDPTDFDDTLGAGGTSPATGMHVDNDDTWVVTSGFRVQRGSQTSFFGTLRVDNETGLNDGEFLNMAVSTRKRNDSGLI